MPIIDKYKDMGTVVMGKIEAGTIREGDSLLIMPNKVFFPIPFYGNILGTYLLEPIQFYNTTL